MIGWRFGFHIKHLLEHRSWHTAAERFRRAAQQNSHRHKFRHILQVALPYIEHLLYLSGSFQFIDLNLCSLGNLPRFLLNRI
ncbi:MAG: hypothetical protein ABSD59_24405 [Terracidiphilus sp.]|jgi:membrane protein YqaA with SNARE-associated domain